MRPFLPGIIVIILMMMMIVIAPLVHASPVPPPPTSPTQSIDDNKSHKTTTTTTTAASDPPKGFHRVMKVVKYLKVVKVVRKYSLVNGPCGDGWPKSPVCYKGLVCVESSDAVSTTASSAVGVRGTCQEPQEPETSD